MKRFTTLCSIIAILLLVAMFVSPVASAATTSTKPLHVVSSSVHPQKPLSCTPGQYWIVSSADVLDHGSIIASVDILADGCGWVQAQVDSSIYTGNAPGNFTAYLMTSNDRFAVVSPTVNYTHHNETYHLKANGAFFYAAACVDHVSVYNYSGCGETATASDGTNNGQ